MSKQSPFRELILASSSRYRQQLLTRLHLPFSTVAPEVDETPRSGEDAAALTHRLARAKAEAVAEQFPQAVVIGSDQVADFSGQAIGKPGNPDRAVKQLLQFSGRTVVFRTAVAVVCRQSGFLQQQTVNTEVCFRTLTEAEVRRYVALDNPLDCAGGFKSEAAGCMLMQSMNSDDPNAIIGLPLISLTAMLRASGYQLP